MQRIVTILPKGEGFSSQQFGAIALCVRDFTLSSRYLDAITVIGGKSQDGFDGIHYQAYLKSRWFENRTRGYARQCINYIRKQKATLVEIHNRPRLLRMIAGNIDAKLALHLHNDPQDMEYARTPKEREVLLAKCGAIYCVSGYIKARFIEGVRTQGVDKLHIVHNGIALPASLPPKENNIVFAGRMTEDKGAKLLAEALAIALPRRPDWKASLIGSRRHSAAIKLEPYEQEVARLLQPVAHQVEQPGFLGHQETLGCFARAHIAVIPSIWQEPFGRTTLEAMAYGCALISSGTGALKEVTGNAALTLEQLTPAALADAILLLTKDSIMRVNLQQQARERAQKFSIEQSTRALDDARAKVLTPVL